LGECSSSCLRKEEESNHEALLSIPIHRRVYNEHKLTSKGKEEKKKKKRRGKG